VKLIHDLLKDWDGEVIRLALLKAHYRSELVWSDSLLKESKEQLEGWYTSLRGLDIELGYIVLNRDVESMILKDMAIPNVLNMLGTLSKKINVGKSRDLEIVSTGVAGMLLASANLLGLLQKDPEEWFKGGLNYDALVEEYDSVRAQALAAKEAGDKAKMGEMFKRSESEN